MTKSADCSEIEGRGSCVLMCRDFWHDGNRPTRYEAHRSPWYLASKLDGIIPLNR